MRKILLLMIILTAFTLVFGSCAVDSSPKEERSAASDPVPGIIMTTNAAYVSFYIEGSTVGSVTVDWGDGESEPCALDSGVNHLYKTNKTQTIKITKGNIYKITKFHAGGCNNAFTSLSMVDLPELVEVNCNDNKLKSIDLSGLTALKRLILCNNDLSSINVNHLTELIYLDIGKNKLSSVNFNGLNKLDELRIANNNFKTLDLSSLKMLRQLYCGYNSMTSLKVSPISKLTYICAQNNKFSAAALNDLFGYLPDYQGTVNSGSIDVSNNYGATKSDLSIATAKKWSAWID